MSPIKKFLITFVLVILNFLVYYYLTELNAINPTFQEIASLLTVSFMVIPIFSLLPALFVFLLRLTFHKRDVFFKKIYLNLYLNISIALYATMMAIGILLYFKQT
ncbi:MAG: hypothetical protein CMF36_16245 [Leeuwenhoekiella sp.]|nr:hypothetical protein [Leeuwenhoekiella sp.]|tara:strand:- start:100055 stop:100369 length:315 start_codon:yes stop_codon:yes gene_type:complete